MKKLVQFSVLLALTLLSSGYLAAQSMYISITGASQGKIQGGALDKGKEGLSSVTAFEHQIVSPRDHATGMATGKRQHSPVVIRKEIDKASPKLYAALANNENLTEVILSFYRPGGKIAMGTSSLWYEIKLKDVMISGIKTSTNEKGQPIEEISFNYQKIQWTFTDGGVTHEDSWNTQRN